MPCWLRARYRFRNAAFDLVVDGESYRAKQKPKIEESGPPPKVPITKARQIGRAQRRTSAS